MNKADAAYLRKKVDARCAAVDATIRRVNAALRKLDPPKPRKPRTDDANAATTAREPNH